MVVLLAAGITTYLLATVRADHSITIGTGPPGTTGHTTAVAMKSGLEKRGFMVDIVTTESTDNLIDLLADKQNPIDVTFVSENVTAHDYPTVESLGTIARRGVLFASTPGHHTITSLAQAKGGLIAIGPKESMMASIAIAVLAQYGITADNTRFINFPSTFSREDIAASGADLVEIVSSTIPDSVRTMLTNGDLRVVPIPEAKALAGLVQSADAVDLPIGFISLNPPVPMEPVPTIAQTITVVADDKLSPAAAFAIARELATEFGPSTQFSDAGEFPNFSFRQLPVNPSAAEYYATSAIPWEYEHLPPILADSFTRILILGTLILIFGSIYSLFLPEVYSLWSGLIKPRAEALRPELSDPIEDETPDDESPPRE